MTAEVILSFENEMSSVLSLGCTRAMGSLMPSLRFWQVCLGCGNKIPTSWVA